jgi:hypothetical protein
MQLEKEISQKNLVLTKHVEEQERNQRMLAVKEAIDESAMNRKDSINKAIQLENEERNRRLQELDNIRMESDELRKENKAKAIAMEEEERARRLKEVREL